MNRLLERQLRRFDASFDRPPAEWQRFLSAVGEAYEQATQDRQLLERSMELASRELLERNARLTKEIHDRERVESELRLAQKLESVGQLASGIAHEINTPIQYVGDSVTFLRTAFEDVATFLSVIDGLAEELAKKPELGELVRRLEAARVAADLAYVREQVPAAFARVQDGISRVSVIVRAMRDFAHPDQTEMVAADVNHGVKSTLVVATNEYKYCADVATELAPLREILCHPGEVNQVLLNLVVNAAHAIEDRWTPQGKRGHIVVATREGDDGVWIEVRDDGCGIPEASRARVFDPFFTTKEVGRGTGQGLALSRAIVVDRHHGKIVFESQVDVGTTFRVWLPFAQPEPAVAA